MRTERTVSLIPGPAGLGHPALHLALHLALLLVLCLALLNAGCSRQPASASAGEPELRAGRYHARLIVQHGQLPFGLELDAPSNGAGWRGRLVNGAETIDLDHIRTHDGIVIIEFPHYDSRIEARIAADRTTLIGEWAKTRGKDQIARVPFRATLGDEPRFAPGPDAAIPQLAGRYRVAFSSSDEPAVGILRVLAEPGPGSTNLAGTIQTTTGDYRYLAGVVRGDRVELSCFDGAHAFLLTGTLDEAGTIVGDFDSGDWWHETWTATPDPDAALPDAFAQTRWNPDADLGDLVFKDLMGAPVSLAEPRFAGHPMLIKVTGSWCPNCNDAAPYIAQLDRTYRDRGLVVVALAFELTGDFERDATQVRRFVTRHGIEFPVLIAGVADKAKASEQLPVLDRVRSYPTTIFMRSDGSVEAIHTGFSGPATGQAYEQLKDEFAQHIEAILDD